MSKTKKLLSVCLGIMLTIVSVFTMNATWVKAEGPTPTPVSGIQISVTFGGENASNGKVLYSATGGGESWTEITASPVTDISVGNVDMLYIKIVANEGKEIDFTAIRLNDELLSADQKSAIAGHGGLMLPVSETKTFSLTNVEFRDAEGGGQGPQGGGQGHQDPPGGPGGDADAHLNVREKEDVYLVWQDGNTVLKHKFEISDNPADSGKLIVAYGEPAFYPLNKVLASTITADGVEGKKYADVFGSKTFWVPASQIADEDLAKMFDESIDPRDREDIQHRLSLNPMGGQDSENAIMCTPDWAFRVAIVTADYQAIEAPRDVEYPESSFNDGLLNFPEIDISGGTESNPVNYRVYLEESKVELKAAEGSNAISSVSVLGAAANGVAVTNPASGVYELAFKSNYFDKVPVKVTMGSKVYYVNVVRTALTAMDNFGPDTTEPAITMQYTYLKNHTHDDFVVMARVVYKNGTVELKKAEVVKVVDGLGNEHSYDWVEGDLCTSAYEVPLASKEVVGVYFTVTSSETDITKASEKTFGGTATGSGLGVYYDVNEREVVY